MGSVSESDIVRVGVDRQIEIPINLLEYIDIKEGDKVCFLKEDGKTFICRF